MEFKKIAALKQLQLNVYNFYEVSRILTKHAANYEAQHVIRDLKTLLDSKEIVSLPKVLAAHSTALVFVLNFLIDTLQEHRDSLNPEADVFEDCVKGMAMSAAVVERAVELLKKYQFKHFDNLFDLAQLDCVNQTLREVAEAKDQPWIRFEKMLTVHDVIIKLSIRYLKFAVAYHLKKDHKVKINFIF
jgi:hypothetical protein